MLSFQYEMGEYSLTWPGEMLSGSLVTQPVYSDTTYKWRHHWWEYQHMTPPYRYPASAGRDRVVNDGITNLY